VSAATSPTRKGARIHSGGPSGGLLLNSVATAILTLYVAAQAAPTWSACMRLFICTGGACHRDMVYCRYPLQDSAADSM
jgi:hypothetical protein